MYINTATTPNGEVSTKRSKNTYAFAAWITDPRTGEQLVVTFSNNAAVANKAARAFITRAGLNPDTIESGFVPVTATAV